MGCRRFDKNTCVVAIDLIAGIGDHVQQDAKPVVPVRIVSYRIVSYRIGVAVKRNCFSSVGVLLVVDRWASLARVLVCLLLIAPIRVGAGESLWSRRCSCRCCCCCSCCCIVPVSSVGDGVRLCRSPNNRCRCGQSKSLASSLSLPCCAGIGVVNTSF